MNTRKYPRTLQQAFGPYTSNEIVDPSDTSYPWTWWALMVAVSLVTLVIVVVTA